MLGNKRAVPSLASFGAFYPDPIRWGEAKVDWMFDWGIGKAGLSPFPWGLRASFLLLDHGFFTGLPKRLLD